MNAPAAGTRRNARLQTVHPRPVQPKDVSLAGITVPASRRSSAFWTAKLWNDLPFAPEVFDSYTKFNHALDAHDWKNCVLTQSLFFRLTDFFGDPGVFGSDDGRAGAATGVRLSCSDGGRIDELPDVCEEGSVCVLGASSGHPSSAVRTLSAERDDPP